MSGYVRKGITTSITGSVKITLRLPNTDNYISAGFSETREVPKEANIKKESELLQQDIYNIVVAEIESIKQEFKGGK